MSKEDASGRQSDVKIRMERDLDEKDLQIIAALQINGRTNFAELATGIDLSQAAIRLRVNRLLESGVLEIVAITDPLSIGFTVQAMIGLTVDGDIERRLRCLDRRPIRYARRGPVRRQRPPRRSDERPASTRRRLVPRGSHISEIDEANIRLGNPTGPGDEVAFEPEMGV
jgi:DNA-binding Lrp family transcriptional regulator